MTISAKLSCTWCLSSLGLAERKDFMLEKSAEGIGSVSRAKAFPIEVRKIVPDWISESHCECFRNFSSLGRGGAERNFPRSQPPHRTFWSLVLGVAACHYRDGKRQKCQGERDQSSLLCDQIATSELTLFMPLFSRCRQHFSAANKNAKILVRSRVSHRRSCFVECEFCESLEKIFDLFLFNKRLTWNNCSVNIPKAKFAKKVTSVWQNESVRDEVKSVHEMSSPQSRALRRAGFETATQR